MRISQLQKEVHEGLITLLVNVTLPEGRDKPYAVITTSPSQWLRYCASDEVTLLDVSEMAGPSLWHTEGDILDRVLAKIQAAGWTKEYLDLQYQARTPVRPDFVLVGNNRKPLAVIELKVSKGYLVDGLRQAQRIAQALNAPYAFASNGDQFLFSDSRSEAYRELNTFPSPEILGVNVIKQREVAEQSTSSNIAIVHCGTPQALVEALNDARAVIIDHTLPWGVVESRITAQIRQFLPEPFRTTRRLDTLTAIMLLVASQISVKRLTAIVPRMVAAYSRYERVRECLSSRLGLAGVIEMPRGTFAPAATIPATIVVLGDYPCRTHKKVAFISLSGRGDLVQPETQDWLRGFKNGLQGQPIKLGFFATVTRNQPWVVSAHHPEVLAAEERVKNIAETASLGELCDIFVGVRHPREEVQRKSGVPVIRGRDLSSDALSKEQLTYYKIKDVPSTAKVQSGDILLQRIGRNPRCILVTEDLEGAIASDTVLVIRPKDERANPVVISEFLRSITGQTLISKLTHGGIVPTVPIQVLKTIPIPLLPEEIVRDLDVLQQIEQDLRTKADRMASMRLNLFNVESVLEFKDRLRDIRHVARAVAASIQQAETLDFQIRNFYPFPLAYTYRTLNALTSPQELYKEQLRVAENVLAFLGSLTLAMIAPEDRKSCGLDLRNLWR
ncbi:MAG: hypothetical protein DRN29_10040, partial [Thermoplasmata archaeon]